MGYQLNKVLLIGFALLLALAIPIFFILTRLLEFRETEALLSQLSSQRTSTAAPTDTLEPTSTHTPTPSPTETPTPSPTFTESPTSTELIIPNTGDEFLNAYIDRVVHIDDSGPQTMIKIVTDGPLEGVFRADIEIQWNSWDYFCFILGDKNELLFCMGRQLPATTNAAIMLYEVIDDGEEQLVFSDTFAVPALGPTKTPKKPQSTQIPTNTPTNTPTITPTNTLVPPTFTPIPPTDTPAPTFTPSSTPTPTLGPPPTPWVPPTDTPTP